jgi:hypothetical protein
VPRACCGGKTRNPRVVSAPLLRFETPQTRRKQEETLSASPRLRPFDPPAAASNPAGFARLRALPIRSPRSARRGGRPGSPRPHIFFTLFFPPILWVLVQSSGAWGRCFVRPYEFRIIRGLLIGFWCGGFVLWFIGLIFYVFFGGGDLCVENGLLVPW